MSNIAEKNTCKDGYGARPTLDLSLFSSRRKPFCGLFYSWRSSKNSGNIVLIQFKALLGL